MTNNENHKTNHKSTSLSLGFESDSNRLVAYAICRGGKRKKNESIGLGWADTWEGRK